MSTWNIQETRDLVAQRFGRHQLDLASPSIQSVVDRQRYARYHYQETIKLFDNFVSTHLTDASLLEVTLGVDEGARGEFELFITKVGAHVLSCVQSMHAVGDILAHAVFFSLGMNLAPRPLTERAISLTNVIERLRTTTSFRPVFALVEELQTGGDFDQLTALANHSKHRSIIRASLSEDLTGKCPERHALKMERFKFCGTTYPEVSVRQFLGPEYDRCSKLVIDIGNAINHVLQQSPP